MSTALSIKGKTQANDAVTSTINYVNPDATNAQLQSLASAMNALTTNTIVDVTRIDKKSLTGAITKLPRNAYLTEIDGTEHITSISASQIGTDSNNPLMLELHFNDQQGQYEDVSLTTSGATGSGNYWFTWSGRSGSVSELAQGFIGMFKVSSSSGAAAVTITIGEDEQYQSETLTLTITAD